MTDSSKTHVTFEDIDGFETITASEGTYAVIQEDGGNAYGERMFLVKLHKDTTKVRVCHGPGEPRNCVARRRLTK